MAMKYDAEFKERTCRHIQSSGKSATSVAEDLGIDKNSVCAWMRLYRRRNHLPSHEEVKVAKKQTQSVQRTKNDAKQLRADQKRIVELEERVEILKKARRIADEIGEPWITPHTARHYGKRSIMGSDGPKAA